MAEGRLSSDWGRTHTYLLAAVVNANRDPKSEAVDPRKLDPFAGEGKGSVPRPHLSELKAPPGNLRVRTVPGRAPSASPGP